MADLSSPAQPVGPVPREAAEPNRRASDPASPDAIPAEVPEGFGDRVARHVAARQSQLVLGLDPDPVRLWPHAVELADRVGSPSALSAERAARAVIEHCRLALAATAEHCVAVKLQAACFERLGAPGWAAMQAVAEAAREHGLLVIVDAKRGDIDVSAAAYAQAFFGSTPTPYGPVAGVGADAMTANPLLGGDSLAPLVSAARDRSSGIFVLVRTSNPGAADLQERPLAEGGTVSGRLASMVAELGAVGVGASGLADVGAVVGATAPERLQALREEMPHAVFLVPGVGAQGGKIEDLGPVFAPGPAGALISVSRGLVGAHERSGQDPARAAREEAARLQALAWRVAA